jgi:magnesium-transporting ATPase (P-type)
MTKFMMNGGIDMYEILKDRNLNWEKVVQLPFDDLLKRKAVVWRQYSTDEYASVIVKGAPDTLIPICKYTHNVP